MLFTITTTYQPATDLGYLLHKNPARVQTFELTFGQAHVFYPDISEDRCTAALLLDVNPVGLVRGGFRLEHYINDRPYATSSFLSVAIAQVYRSALNGKSSERAALVETPIPLEAKLTALPCRGGESLLRRLFEPLGYQITAERYPLDSAFPAWGESAYYTVTLSHTLRLKDVLAHVYVLIPVLDNDKHYYVGSDEVEKLLKHGEGWLQQHPELKLITRRYLRHYHSLVDDALARLVSAETPIDDNDDQPINDDRVSLHQQRLQTVYAVLKNSGAQRVLDLGCGEGKLMTLLIKDRQFTQIVGMDVAHRSLENAAERLHLDRLPGQRVQLLHSSLMYRDDRLGGFDAAAAVEVIEHLDPPRLASFERVLFEFARPGLIVLTTPNAEYNVKWESLPAGQFRHADHRFEWTRAEFQAWAERMSERFGYTVRCLPLGEADASVGAASQMGIFERSE